MIPPDKIILAAAKVSGQMDLRPICFDYYGDSLTGQVNIGVRKDGTKFLVKDEDEYTSNIEKILKVSDEKGVDHYIAITENSIYIVIASIKPKRVSEDFI